MKIGCQSISTVLSVKEETMKDGNKYYKMAIMQEGEAGSISCTEDVFKSPFEPFKEYVLDLIYDDKYGRMRAVAFHPYTRK